MDSPAPEIPTISRKAARSPPMGSSSPIISSVDSMVMPRTNRVPAATAMTMALRKTITDADTSASRFSRPRSSAVHPFSATTVLRTMKTAAEQVVPAMAATRRLASGVSGIDGTMPATTAE